MVLREATTLRCGLAVRPQVFWVLLLPVLFLATSVHAQSQCRTELAEAENHYSDGRFDEAIAILNRCLGKSGLNEEERKQAYKLLGKTYIAKDYLKEAREAIRKLLEVVPNFEPDPVQDSPAFTKMVKDVKSEQKNPATAPKSPTVVPEKKKGGSKTWLWIGGALVVGGAAALLLGGSGGNGGGEVIAPDLPAPPPSFP